MWPYLDRRVRQPVEPPRGRRVPAARALAQARARRRRGARLPGRRRSSSPRAAPRRTTSRSRASRSPSPRGPAHRHDADRARGGARVGRLPGAAARLRGHVRRRRPRRARSRPPTSPRRCGQTRRSRQRELANNEVGTVQPIAELAALAHEHGIPFHTDAVQAAGWLPLDVATLGVDALSVSGHKLGAPEGHRRARTCGGASRSSRCIHGGGQERGRRSGTENVAGAVGARHRRPARRRSAPEPRRGHRAARRVRRQRARGGAGCRAHRAPAHAAARAAHLRRSPARTARPCCSNWSGAASSRPSGSACAAGSDEPRTCCWPWASRDRPDRGAIHVRPGDHVGQLDEAAEALIAVSGQRSRRANPVGDRADEALFGIWYTISGEVHRHRPMRADVPYHPRAHRRRHVPADGPTCRAARSPPTSASRACPSGGTRRPSSARDRDELPDGRVFVPRTSRPNRRALRRSRRPGGSAGVPADEPGRWRPLPPCAPICRHPAMPGLGRPRRRRRRERRFHEVLAGRAVGRSCACCCRRRPADALAAASIRNPGRHRRRARRARRRHRVRRRLPEPPRQRSADLRTSRPGVRGKANPHEQPIAIALAAASCCPPAARRPTSRPSRLRSAHRCLLRPTHAVVHGPVQRTLEAGA